MSIEHDEKDASAINFSWWVDELMSIEHDEKDDSAINLFAP